MLHRRDLAELEAWESISSESNASYTLNTPEEVVFGANTSCVLTPEAIIGPYWVKGELIRKNVTETQIGVPMHLDMQFVDISTCKPIPQLMIDIWSANATGVYSGVALGEGGLDTSFLRGVQMSDRDGVVQFDTIFPGHYTERATHEHVTSHVNSTLLPNGTYTGGTVTHIGQLFFEESLKHKIEATYPYDQNTQAYTTNDDDEGSIAANATTAAYDPFPEWLMLSDQLSDGLLMWISIGVNMSANYDSDAIFAASWTADGGVANPNFSYSGTLP
jgi:protocatechuate 3,4-dioxygenase beta subunit